MTTNWPDTRCMLAVEERDLPAEAVNLSGQEEALVNLIIALYPNRSLNN